jgi:hypothetical protein
MSLLDNIQNYYENLVLESLAELARQEALDEDVMIDIVCIALNHLPPRYIRHEVDMVYYTSPIERAEIAQKAKEAVHSALDYIRKNSRA